jgi:hypothetical protein
MGARFLPAPLLLIGVWSAACSKPVEAPLGRTADHSLPTRDLRMAGEVDSSTVVSDLEAHRPAVVRRRTEPKTESTAPLAAIEVAPKLASPAPTAEVTQTLAAAPAAAAPVEVVESVRYQGGGSQMSDGGTGGGFDAAPISRYPTGPSVIIRGGRGGVDDDCDLHRPGIRRFGGQPAAVHSLAPPVGGYPRGSR